MRLNISEIQIKSKGASIINIPTDWSQNPESRAEWSFGHYWFRTVMPVLPENLEQVEKDRKFVVRWKTAEEVERNEFNHWAAAKLTKENKGNRKKPLTGTARIKNWENLLEAQSRNLDWVSLDKPAEKDLKYRRQLQASLPKPQEAVWPTNGNRTRKTQPMQRNKMQITEWSKIKNFWLFEDWGEIKNRKREENLGLGTGGIFIVARAMYDSSLAKADVGETLIIDGKTQIHIPLLRSAASSCNYI